MPANKNGTKTTAKKTTAKKTTAKKTTAKKTTAKKTTAKKTTAKKTTAKKTSAKKTSAKKTSAKKTSAKKTSAKKTSAKKTTARKTTEKKVTAKRLTARRATTTRSTPVVVRADRPVSRGVRQPARAATPVGRTSTGSIKARQGDLIVIDSAQVGSPPREGEVLKVIHGEVSISYRIKWTDGTETLISPAAGTAHIVRT